MFQNTKSLQGNGTCGEKKTSLLRDDERAKNTNTNYEKYTFK